MEFKLEPLLRFRLGLLVETRVTSSRNQILTSAPLCGLVCVVALVVYGAAVVPAQTGQLPGIAPQAPSNTNSNKRESPDFGSPENEMRAKLVIKEEKKRYDEHLERAREVSQLASQLLRSYEATRAFTSEDNKKLERMEKLTKRIRNEAGGSEADAEVKDMPSDVTAAIKDAAEMAEDLRKLVEKTPRHVISAAVIEQANKLIVVIRFVRAPGS